MAVRGIGFQEAVSILEPYASGHAAVALAKPEILVIQEVPTENPARHFTYEKHFVSSAWLQARNLAPGTLERYGVGCYDNPARQSAYKGRILIRVQRFSDGGTVGYLARDPRPEEERGGDPKYMWPRDVHKSLELFGAFQLKDRAPLKSVFLVESPFCVVKFAQMGLPAVSPFGWSVSEAQAEVIAMLARGVVCLPDSDKREQFEKSAWLLARRMWCRVPPLPDNVRDPEHLTREQILALTA
jgi:hypothetical protein